MKPKGRIFIFAIITLLCAFSMRDQRLSSAQQSSYWVYRIRFEYYGMDAAGMEKLITIPLEEGLSGLGNIAEIRSSCEYGLAETTVFFNRETQKKQLYLALRDTVDSLYRELPGAVQKPRIYEAGSGRQPFFSIAVRAEPGESLNHLRSYLEQNVKRELENLEGIGEVIVSGGSITEVHIEFDPDRGAETGLDPAGLGSIVQDANVLYPGGIIHGEEANQTVYFNTRIKELDEIKKLPVKAGEEISTLEYFADIGFGPRERREFFTLDGEECAGVSITAVPGANLVALSRQCREIFDAPGTASRSLEILRDEGEQQREMLRGMVIAFIQSFAAVAIIIPFFLSSPRLFLVIILFLPICVVWSLGILRIGNIGVDQFVLSGLSISLGLVIDPWLVIAAGSPAQKVDKLAKGIIASALTTVLVIFPLCFLDSIAPGIQKTAVTLMTMVGNSLILGLVFFPVFLGEGGGKHHPPAMVRRFHRATIRLGYSLSLSAAGHRRVFIAIYTVLGLSSLLLFFQSGKNLNMDFRLPLLYVSVEFESAKSAEAVNRDLEELSRRIKKEKGVAFVRLESRNGTGDFEIGYDEKIVRRRDLAAAISSLAPLVGDGFLYVPDTDSGFKQGIYEVEISAVDGEGENSRELAKEGARIAGNLKGTVQTVLNFKDPAPLIVFRPDREILAKSGMGLRDLGASLRWLLFGPVTGKWVQDGHETDIRIMGAGLAKGTRSSLGNLALPSPAGPMRLESFGLLEEAPGEGTIYRRDGRRVSYFTVHVAAGSAGEAAALLRTALNRDQKLGSGFLLSRELESLNSQYFTIFLVFLGSFAGIFLILLGMTENGKSALRISSIIPVSCALPLLVKFINRSPLEMGDAVALVVIAGLSVNNGVFIEESAFSLVHRKVRDKILPILVTSLTSIAGALPLALLGEEGFSSALSRGILWGTVGSLLASLLFFPALYPLVWDRRNNEHHSGAKCAY